MSTMQILLLAAVLVSSGWALPGARIIGGREAFDGEFPFAAAIYKQTADGSYFCVGALLNTEWILTSGTCVESATLFTIYIGTNDLDSSDATRLSTDIYFAHPDFNPETLDADLGLIQLRLPVTWTDYVQPIGLPVEDVQNYAVVSAIGWGQTNDENAGLVNSLRTVTLIALTNEECKLHFGNQILDYMVCVDGNYNEGTCHGDTGGPLIQYVNKDHATVVGVSSFVSGKGCETPEPSGYIRTYPYLEWITNHTQSVIR